MAETEQTKIRQIFLEKMKTITLRSNGYRLPSYPKGSFIPLALSRIQN